MRKISDLIKLQEKALELKVSVIRMLDKADAGHVGGAFSMADLMVALYYNIAKIDPKNPDWEERDRLILSNGHICPVRYAAMAESGYFPVEELKTLRKMGSRLQGHPERTRLTGVETTSGPLGSGLAQAAGIAWAAKMDEKRFRIYCICSDAEHDEGNHWEGVLFAAKYKLSNLTLIIDRNNIQSDGFTKDILPLEPLEDKYNSFGWHVLNIDGHNFEEILTSIDHAKATYEKPTVIIAHTIPGKGISFMENKFEWHSKVLDKKQANLALKELEAKTKEIKTKK